MRRDAGLEIFFPWWLVSNVVLCGRLLHRSPIRRDSRCCQIMGRLTRAAGEHHYLLIGHSLNGHAQRVDRPTLLKKGSTTNDLGHDCLHDQSSISAIVSDSPLIIDRFWGRSESFRLHGRRRQRRAGSSRHGSHGRIFLRWYWLNIPCLSRTASFAYPRPGF